MPSLRWDDIAELGILPVYCDGYIPERAIAYVPGMRTDEYDCYLIQGRVDHVRRYVDAGGDPAKGICHFLTHDDYLLEPLWGPALERRIIGFKELGVNTIIAPDFSTWGQWPLIVHLHNYYRSNVVANDFYKAGFHVVCHPNFTHPKLYEFSAALWDGPCPTVLVDAIHSYNSAKDAFTGMFIDCMTDFLKGRDCNVAIWGRYRRQLARFSVLHKRTFFVPSFVAMRAQYINAVQAEVRNRKRTKQEN